MTNKISESLEIALRMLLIDESVAHTLLGYEDFQSRLNLDSHSNLDPGIRIRMLSERLESYIVQMSLELDELGPDELLRLRAEATAFLVALREIRTFFPEFIESRLRDGGSD